MSFFALTLALVGPVAVLLIARSFGVDTISYRVRIALWLLLAVVLAIAFAGEGLTISMLGLRGFSAWSIPSGLVAGFVILPIFPLVQFVTAKAGLDGHDTGMMQRIGRLSTGQRAFIVITAAIVEESLYRGYAIGRGSELVGGMGVAATLSLMAFTVAHFSWHTVQLILAFLVGAALTGLFVWQCDLVACIVAHGLIDGVAFLLMPALAKHFPQRIAEQ